MHGTILFNDAESLATFLRVFTGSTATFTVVPDGDGFRLTFTGGY
jgi:hypothetical protein